jgi:cytochrome c-type biogenesis protein CcmF
MIAVLGQFTLSLAAACALLLLLVPLWGIHTGRWRAINLGGPLAYAQGVLLAVSFTALTVAFVQDAFYVIYVSQHSNSALPLAYKIAAVWGGHEGSLLLWVFILSLWTVAVARFSTGLPRMTRARVLAVLGAVAFGFDVFILLTSNPFRLFASDYPIDGADLNPLLQDPGLVVHPPMLYMGYVGFSVAFAFALAALLEGRIDTLWARWVRPWTLAAWMFLTIGITLGSWWAYYELGWGGWWFWDPVENASFMPWLLGTALLHSLAATEKRGVFKAWTTLLAIAAFSFSLLGTFLVRSGVLTSVHAFANDPVRGTYILVFLAVVVGVSLTLFAVRAHAVTVHAWFDYASRETLFLVNNLLLVVAAFSILFGTLQPIIAEAVGWGKVSVGAPYFNVVFNAIMTPLIVLVGMGPLSRWRQMELAEIVRRLRWSGLLALALALLVPWVLPDTPQKVNWQLGLGVFLAVWAFGGQVTDMLRRTQNFTRRRSLGMAYVGMYLAHIGLALAVFGVVLSSHLSIERNIRLAPGEETRIAGYRFVFETLKTVPGPNYLAQRGAFKVFRGDRLEAELHPEKRRYGASGKTMTEAAIDWGLTRDVYVALGEPQQGGQGWSLRIYVKPFVRWIWIGGICMALGGLLAMLDRRYRRRSRYMTEEVA